MIYLDHAATTRVSQAVLDAMMPYMALHFANPSSAHAAGRAAMDAVENARQQVAEPILAEPSHIFFTSGGSEANTLALLGMEAHLRKLGRIHLVISPIEHASVLRCAEAFQQRGFSITFLPVSSSGVIDPYDVERAITPRTGLVSVMGINNETGTEQKISSIGRLCHAYGILFHSDCVQAYCQRKITVPSYHIDLLTASAHKIGGPKGAGFLYAARPEYLSPVIYGGGQEGGLRGGTENVPAIVGFGAAARAASEQLNGEADYASVLRACLERTLSETGVSYQINGLPSHIVSLRFDGIDGETLALLLSKQGIMVSTGSACASHTAEPSHVLLAMGLTQEQARSTIRVSFCANTTMDEVVHAARAIAVGVQSLMEEHI